MNLRLFAKPMLMGLLVCVYSFMANAQNQAITGKVINSKDGAPIAGASVQVKGSNTGTSTGDDGSFTLNAPTSGAALTVSYVGYETQTVKITSNLGITVSLVSSTEGLGEVVVVGYGTQKKKEITSAIATVKAEDFNKGNISNVAQLLQGKVAGLSISKPGGNPNAGYDIRLRGLSTVGANSSPLVVIDGQLGADLNTVDPNDIATISILKDGSSAAIYGSRGSAGVIIVTTKGGQRGGAQVSYGGVVTVESPARYTPVMTPAEYRETMKATGVGTDLGSSTEWYKAITRTAISHSHNLSLSGGTERTTYNLSLNVRKNDGVALKTGFMQLNGRAKITHRAFDNRAVFNLEMSTTNKEAQLGQDNAFKLASNFNPTFPIYARNAGDDLAGGGYFEIAAFDTGNPFSTLVQNSNNYHTKRFNITPSLEIELIKGLKLLTRYGLQSTAGYGFGYSPRNAYGDGFNRKGLASKRYDNSKSQLYENTLSYNTKISKMDIAAVIGYSYQDFANQGNSIQTGDFVTDLGTENLAFSQDITAGKALIGGYKNQSVLLARFARVNLNYNDFAYLFASIRKEGSSQFGKNNKWGYFPAVGGGLDLDKLLSIPTFSSLKIRASYGITGQLPPFPYLSIPLYSPGALYPVNGSPVSAYGPTQNHNPNLKWERKAETNIGLDIVALNNRLTATLDYYVRRTTDLIYLTSVPSPPNLTSTTWLNVADLKGSGFELALNYKVFQNKAGVFSWIAGINLAQNTTKLLNLNGLANQGGAQYLDLAQQFGPGGTGVFLERLQVGHKIGEMYGAVYKGVNDAGMLIYDDGKGGTTTSHTAYKTVIGNGLPKIEMGLNNSFAYKNFDLNLFLRGSFGHNLINTSRLYQEYPKVVGSYNGIKTKYYNPAVTVTAGSYSSLQVEDGSFVKLDNATLGYNFGLPKKGFGKSFKAIRAYITGYNLFTITNYTGADPEVRYVDNDGSGTISILAPGVDRRTTWVLTRSFSFGINLTFQ